MEETLYIDQITDESGHSLGAKPSIIKFLKIAAPDLDVERIGNLGDFRMSEQELEYWNDLKSLEKEYF